MKRKESKCSKGRMLKGKVQSNILLIYFMSFRPDDDVLPANNKKKVTE